MPAAAALAWGLIAGCGSSDGGPTFPEQHPRIYLPEQGARIQALLDAGDPAAVRFATYVDLHVDGANLYDFRGWMVALMGQLRDDPKYCTFAVAQVDAMVASNEAAIASGATPMVAFDSYLDVGPIVGDIAMTYDWCADVVTGGQRARWLTFADRAVWNVWHPTEASWNGVSAPWTGWSIDNPSNNYYYSFLRATMMLGLATHGEAYDGVGSGDQWLTKFRDEKIAGQLIPTFDTDLVGGGSREGTGYGTAMHRLFELYAMWQGSTGEDLASQTPHTRASLLQFMHATMPTRDRFAPIGDQSRDSTAMLFDYHRNLVEELAFQFAGDPLAPRAQYLLANSSVPEMALPYMFVYDFLFAQPAMAPQPLDGLGTTLYAPGVGQLFARSSWAPDATWWNFIAGPYTESHAHRDQGSIMVFKGEWMAYDAVIDSQSGLRQDEESHNLVRIVDGNGVTVAQHVNTTSIMQAVAHGPGWVHAAGDLAPAYGDASPVTGSQREVVFIAPDTLVVFDRVASIDGTSQVWQLNSPLAPAVDGTGATFTGSAHSLRVDRVLPADATANVVDLPSSDGDFHGGHRYQLTVPGGVRRFLNVLSTDGAVTAVQASGDAGVAITLADGRTATVSFGLDGVDGHLAITGSVPVDVALRPGINPLPE